MPRSLAFHAQGQKFDQNRAVAVKQYKRVDHRHRRELAIALVATALVVVAVLLYLIASGYHDEFHAAETATRNYAAVVEARLDSTLRRVDADLQGLADAIPLAALDTQAVPRFTNAIQPALRARRVNFPELDSIRVFDASGNVIYYSDQQRPARINISDLPHFRAVGQSVGDGLIFSEVIVARTTNRPGLFIMKPLRDAQGVFRGAIGAGISLDYFDRLFQSLDVGAHGAVSWRRSDTHQLVHRWPAIDALVNKPLSPNNPTVLRLATGKRVSTEHITAETDGVARIYSTNQLENYPFYVGVAFSLDDVLAAWRARALVVALCCLFLVVPLLLLLYRLWRVEDSLIENEELMRGTFEQAAVGIVHIDPESLRILMVNDRYCELLGYTRSELVSMDTRELTPEDERAEREDERLQVIEGSGRTVASERRLIRRDGSLLWVNRNLSLVRDSDGAPKYFIAVIEDISSRKQAEADLAQLNAELENRIAYRTEELEAANKELSAFSYTVAHDLRTPLRAINGYSSMALESGAGKFDATTEKQLQRVVAASARMGNLIDDLLNLARLSRQDMQLGPVDLSALALEVAAAISEAQPNPNVRVSVQPGMTAECDAGLVRALLQNLIGNAWKFSAKVTAPKIEVVAAVRDGCSVFSVADNGAGFDMQYAHKLFAPFQRLHHTSEFDGTGIGLATVKKIIQRHGGTVWIESALGAGTTVFFTLGAAALADRAAA